MEIHFIFPVLAGFVVGFLIGLTGMGGGALMTPFLILIMKMNPILAVGTDLTFATITKITGSFWHRREENTSFRAVGWMALGSLPASFIAARLVLRTAPESLHEQNFLSTLLGAVLVLVGIIVLARNIGIFRRQDEAEERWPSPPILTLMGIIGGFLVGLTSIGGGTVIMALLLIFFSIPLNHMVGLDVAHAAVLTFVPAATYAWNGQTEWSLVGLLLVGSIPGVWLGAHAVNRVDHRIVQRILGVVILVIGLQLLLR